MCSKVLRGKICYLYISYFIPLVSSLLDKGFFHCFNNLVTTCYFHATSRNLRQIDEVLSIGFLFKVFNSFSLFVNKETHLFILFCCFSICSACSLASEWPQFFILFSLFTCLGTKFLTSSSLLSRGSTVSNFIIY